LTSLEWLPLLLAAVNLLTTAAMVGAAHASLRSGQQNLSDRVRRLEEASDRHNQSLDKGG
jgi:CHASE1-domain containing sensor protein